MKGKDCSNPPVVGCDDGIVLLSRARYTIASCIAWNAMPVGASLGLLRVDGLDASSVIPFLALKAAGCRPRAVLLDSVTIAGFNVISPSILSRFLRTPVIVVYNYRPSRKRLEAGLERLPIKNLRRLVIGVVDKAEELETWRGRVYVIPWNITIEEAKAIIEATQMYSRIPEPVRIAHRLASEISRLLLGIS